MALVLAGGLAACGDDDVETGGAGTDTTTAAGGADAVDVTMTEYAYSISGDLKPGGTIRLSNAGKEFHMISLGRLKPGKTIGDVTTILQEFAAGPPEETTTTAGSGATTTTAASGATTTTASGGATTTAVAGAAGQEEEEEDPFLEVMDEIGAPGGFQGPGQRAEITVPNLSEGTYAVVCYVPTEVEGTPHFAKGMVGQLRVAGEKADEPTADAAFQLEPGKAITGPSTLSAGRKVLKFEATGAGADQMEPGMAKLNPGATPADINRAFAVLFATDTPPANAAATVPGQLVFSLFDLGDASDVYVAVDLTAGTYGMVANDTDVDTPPEDPVEKITFTVT